MKDLERHGDLILPQGTYTLVQDGANGQVDVIVGPHKASLAETDTPVIYDHETRRFNRIGASDAIMVNPTANEGQYIILSNPSEDIEGKKHPTKGKQSAQNLLNGHKINIPGPYDMPLFPGQIAKVLDGHHLKSNEYLICRVYNEDAAKENFSSAIIKPTGKETEEETKKNKSKNDQIKLIPESDLVIGKLFVIKGTDVSFYIPPTGIEVVKGEYEGEYVRKANTLERLEYCILLGQNGDKRFVRGPDVVFPKPTEEFVKQGNNIKFKAIELNENMGIYVKVIAEYEKYKSGDEIFITGETQKIYFPRPEHAIIKYGDQMIHYATAVTAGEARYILNKKTGAVEMVTGPEMLLPDPRKSVIVKRALDERTVNLWFPGNEEALEYNQKLKGRDLLEEAELGETQDFSNDLSRSLKNTVRFAAVADEMERSSTYSKPRTITLDTKYEGAVRINVWPGHAIQVVKKTGERILIEGPKVRLLEYDEDLEVLSLSTGKPKNDHNNTRTTYLQKDNNVVSDIIEAETSDSVDTSVRLSYRVNFDEKHKDKWFAVSDYVKLLTQHMRSIVRNKIKKTSIEEFNANATDIIRNLILGEPNKDGKRPGRLFEENGMRVYDIEVLKIQIGNEEIKEMLKDAQQGTVAHRLLLQKKQQEFEFNEATEELERKTIDVRMLTLKKRQGLTLTEIGNIDEVRIMEIENENERSMKKHKNEKVIQEFINYVETASLNRVKAKSELKLSQDKTASNIRTVEHDAKMKAIQPGLIEAITTMTNTTFAETLAKNLSHRNNGLGQVFAGGFEGILDLVKGSPLEAKLKSLVESGRKIHNGDDK